VYRVFSGKEDSTAKSSVSFPPLLSFDFKRHFSCLTVDIYMLIKPPAYLIRYRQAVLSKADQTLREIIVTIS
jgi:hypothetical protein